MGAALLEKQEFAKAESHFLEAIAMGEEMLRATDESNTKQIKKISRSISDRKGNMVVLKLHQQDFSGAFELLEKLLLEDKKMGYIMGCVVKQGILGHYYLRQDEIKSAERVFSSALAFVRQKDEKLFESSWNYAEAEVAEQVCQSVFPLMCIMELMSINCFQACLLVCVFLRLHYSTLVVFFKSKKCSWPRACLSSRSAGIPVCMFRRQQKRWHR